jgi:acyl carrier protein
MPQAETEAKIERFVRARFKVAAADPGFTVSADLYDEGYVDSIGIVELVTFVEEEFNVEIPEEEMLGPDFSSISGIARIVARMQAAGGQHLPGSSKGAGTGLTDNPVRA